MKNLITYNEFLLEQINSNEEQIDEGWKEWALW